MEQSSSVLPMYTVTYTPDQFNNKELDPTEYPQTLPFTPLYDLTLTEFNNQTVEQVLNNPAYYDAKVTSFNVTITGTHEYICGNGTKVTIDIYDVYGNLVANPSYSNCPSGGLKAGQDNVNINETVINNPMPTLGRYTINFQNCYGHCSNNRMNFYNVIVTFTLTLQVGRCDASSINQPACVQYCISNLENCLPSYLTYCLATTNNDPKTLVMATNKPCQSYFQNYIISKGPISQLDTALSSYCAAKYAGFGSLFSSSNLTDQQLCACHMPIDQYRAYENQLISQYPNFGSLGLVDQCLLSSMCVESL